MQLQTWLDYACQNKGTIMVVYMAVEYMLGKTDYGSVLGCAEQAIRAPFKKKE